jgi:hypothetical protein
MSPGISPLRIGLLAVLLPLIAPAVIALPTGTNAAGQGDFHELITQLGIAGLVGRRTGGFIYLGHPVEHLAVATHIPKLLGEAASRELEIIFAHRLCGEPSGRSLPSHGCRPTASYR